ncbi:hypothetical protein N7454_006231 [Penicillium verhagenii]|nr:hypothetical protein N7454_006231 [Penicillium verhagenii]
MTGKLCSNCAKIPPPRYFNRSSNFPHRTIGTKERITRHKDSCPFCRLVYNALFAGPVHYTGTDKWEIAVIWNGNFYYFSTGFDEPDIRLAVIQEEKKEPSPANYARPITGTQVSISKLKTWLSLCEKNHRKQGSALQQTLGEPAPPVAPGRVIDVKDACVIAFPGAGGTSKTRYVTLSYVWGDAAQYTLSKKTKTRLMSRGSLDAIRERIPKTIVDAMEVVKRMGIRYLWVDALCIVQDDAGDKAKEIHRMDSIYEGSAFTLVAASGRSANAGLAPVHRRKGEQVVETIWPGIRMTAIHSVTEIIENMKYGTRGWTFQEQNLSSRLLVFTDDIVYFKCHRCVWSENSRADETPKIPTAIGGPRSLDNMDMISIPWQMYSDYMGQYSQRQLTNEEDIVNAMTGILNRISRKLKCTLLYGLLTDSFEWSLLFSTTYHRRRAEFPSYSWAGWKGEFACSFPEPDDFDRDESESSSDDDFDPERLSTQARETAAKNSWIVWHERQPDGSLHLLIKRDNVAARKQTIKTLKQYLFKKRARMEDSVSAISPTKTLQHIAFPAYSVLQFWTISLSLRVQEFPVPSAHRADLVNNQGRICGQLQIPKDLKPTYGAAVEIILLLSCNVTEALVPNRQRWNGVDSAGAIQMANGEPLELFKVMWIQSNQGISERMAVGEIQQKALRHAESKPVWKEIILK